jgi:hypothetical protein
MMESELHATNLEAVPCLNAEQVRTILQKVLGNAIKILGSLTMQSPGFAEHSFSFIYLYSNPI